MKLDRWILIVQSEANEESARASAENISGGAYGKRPKNSKKITKNSTIKPLKGGNRKKNKIGKKKTENSTIKPLSTISGKM